MKTKKCRKITRLAAVVSSPSEGHIRLSPPTYERRELKLFSSRKVYKAQSTTTDRANSKQTRSIEHPHHQQRKRRLSAVGVQLRTPPVARWPLHFDSLSFRLAWLHPSHPTSGRSKPQGTLKTFFMHSVKCARVERQVYSKQPYAKQSRLLSWD